MTDKLTFRTLALRRALPSDEHELAPVTAPALAAYGSEAQTQAELGLALSELSEETKPARASRSATMLRAASSSCSARSAATPRCPARADLARCDDPGRDHRRARRHIDLSAAPPLL